MNSNNVKTTNPVIVVIFWLYVIIPLAWGVSSTLEKAAALFR
jgi:hypothetical protein